jgi:hypothetical protein
MRRLIPLIAIAAVALALLGAAVAIFEPTLAPTYLYYDLVGRWGAPLPAEVERFVLQSGEEYCARGHDSECGGYRVTGGRTLPVGPAAQGSGIAAAWCVDYVTLRRNLGRAGDLIYWAKVPGAMVVTRMNDGRYESSVADSCATAVVQ